MPNLNQTIKDIKSIKIQGASNICRASIAAWYDYLSRWRVRQVGSYLSEAKRVGNLLAKTRPDEPLAVNAFKYLNKRLEDARRVKNPQSDVAGLKKLSKQAVADWSTLIHENGKRLAFWGAKMIKNKENIFTHCHSRTVINVLAKAKEDKKKIHVYHDETRPLMQGRLTAEDLARLNIESTMVVDAAAAFLVSNFSGDKVKIDKVIIGFDVILPDNSALNKIGSFGIALAAYTSKIPVYLAGSLLKKTTQKMEIELRAKKEVWANGPKETQIVNFAFDRIPTQLITGYITEFGIIKPSEVDKYVKKYYPWTLKNQN
ncbi:MAG TPA: translation initiation factor eIF-2B [Patescibacteria group bacterium]|nr:translation initiation factor eIF-2B [Patescibacteria group bacterium]